MRSTEIDDTIEGILVSARDAEFSQATGDEEALYYHLNGMKVLLESLFMQKDSIRRLARDHTTRSNLIIEGTG